MTQAWRTRTTVDTTDPTRRYCPRHSQGGLKTPPQTPAVLAGRLGGQ